MTINYKESKLKGVYIIDITSKFEDYRGEYSMLYNKELYQQLLPSNTEFVEDDISLTYKHNFKGIHGDDRTYKLISCLYGKFYLIILNNNPESDQYLKWEGFTLSDKNRIQILVPPKFGNGHLAISDPYSIFHYKQTSYYDPSRQFTLIWNNPLYNIRLPIKNPIISQRDEEGHIII